MSGDLFFHHSCKGSAAGILWGEVRDAAMLTFSSVRRSQEFLCRKMSAWQRLRNPEFLRLQSEHNETCLGRLELGEVCARPW